MKTFIKKIAPKRLINLYHWIFSYAGAVVYGFPSRRMIIIGVTGTKGKTSTSNFLWAALQGAGLKTGIISTAIIRIGDEELPNSMHMTMPGRFTIERYLCRMADAGCKAAVVETTSQGLIQNRHVGIDYDIAIYTGLSPEHLESHGSFENYLNAKKILFKIISSCARKEIGGKKIPKGIIVNLDDRYAAEFLQFDADKKLTFGIENKSADIEASCIREEKDGISFHVSGSKVKLHLPGIFNIYNFLPVAAVGRLLGLEQDTVFRAGSSIRTIPGRFEEINEGQPFRVFVDYAHEKLSMTNALKTARSLAGDSSVIVLFGSEGGGRDKIKRSSMAEVAAKLADIAVISSTDPYDEEPAAIAEEIATSCESFGMVRNRNLFILPDRREGIDKCLTLAKRGDVVIITGKGAEMTMLVKNGAALAWDERAIVREEVKKIAKESSNESR